MNIKSDVKTNRFNVIRYLNALHNLIMYGIMLGMSYEYMPENPMYVLILVSLSLVLINFKYVMAPKEFLQQTEDSPIQQTLSDFPILGVLNLLLAIGVLGTLIMGNLVGWYWFLAGLIVSSVITKMHKEKVGVVFKKS